MTTLAPLICVLLLLIPPAIVVAIAARSKRTNDGDGTREA